MNITLLFRLVLLFEIVWGAQAWFTWWINDSRLLQYVFYIIAAIVSYNYKQKNRIRLNKSPYVLFGMLCYVLAVMFFNRFSLASLASVALILYPLWVALSDKENVEGHLHFVCKWLAVIFIPGIILYLLKGVIPAVGFISQKGSSDSYIFINQIFLIHRLDATDLDSLNRFHSIFLEPGFIGSMLTFLLFAIKYDFSKWYTKVLLLSLIMSLSLAGYVLTFLGYFMYLMSNGRSLKKVIIFMLFVPVIYVASKEYNGGHNYFNAYILSRLEYDEEKGIAGNNRTGEGTDYYYNQAVSDGSIWLGLGAERVNKINSISSDSSDGNDTNIKGAGYKVFFVVRGIISAVFFLLFYFFIATGCCKNRMIRYAGTILILVTFIPQATPQSTSWLYPFVLGMLNYNHDSLRKR